MTVLVGKYLIQARIEIAQWLRLGFQPRTAGPFLVIPFAKSVGNFTSPLSLAFLDSRFCPCRHQMFAESLANVLATAMAFETSTCPGGKSGPPDPWLLLIRFPFSWTGKFPVFWQPLLAFEQVFIWVISPGSCWLLLNGVEAGLWGS